MVEVGRFGGPEGHQLPPQLPVTTTMQSTWQSTCTFKVPRKGGKCVHAKIIELKDMSHAPARCARK